MTKKPEMDPGSRDANRYGPGPAKGAALKYARALLHRVNAGLPLTLRECVLAEALFTSSQVRRGLHEAFAAANRRRWFGGGEW